MRKLIFYVIINYDKCFFDVSNSSLACLPSSVPITVLNSELVEWFGLVQPPLHTTDTTTTITVRDCALADLLLVYNNTS